MSRGRDVLQQLREYPLARSIRRLVDDRPIQCSLYVTDRCNLDCAYCTEYDNSRDHPTFDELSAWLRKIRDLGTMRVALVGGEPLLHPRIVDLVALSRRLGLATSVTTNGFLLTPELIDELGRAGLQTMQISVDRMSPSPITRKSFRTLLPKMQWLRDAAFRVHVTGVICDDTIDESREVLMTGLAHGFPTEVRLVHADPSQRYRVDPPDRRAAEGLLEWMREAKARGLRIHTSESILAYQLAQVRGEPFEWTCTAGYKIFFVSAQGKFWLCSMRPTDRHILDLEPEDLLAYRGPKPCQEGCGIYCAVGTSLVHARPVRTIGREVRARARGLWSRDRRDLPPVAAER